MANTTSGTTTFDKTFSIDEIIEELNKNNLNYHKVNSCLIQIKLD